MLPIKVTRWVSASHVESHICQRNLRMLTVFKLPSVKIGQKTVELTGPHVLWQR